MGCIGVVVVGMAVVVATPLLGGRAMDGAGQASAHPTAWDSSAISTTRCIAAKTKATTLTAAHSRSHRGVVDRCRASFPVPHASLYRNLFVRDGTAFLRAAQDLLRLECEF